MEDGPDKAAIKAELDLLNQIFKKSQIEIAAILDPISKAGNIYNAHLTHQRNEEEKIYETVVADQKYIREQIEL